MCRQENQLLPHHDNSSFQWRVYQGIICPCVGSRMSDNVWSLSGSVHPPQLELVHRLDRGLEETMLVHRSRFTVQGWLKVDWKNCGENSDWAHFNFLLDGRIPLGWILPTFFKKLHTLIIEMMMSRTVTERFLLLALCGNINQCREMIWFEIWDEKEGSD